MGGAFEGLWPHKHENVVFTQKWVLEVWSDPWVDQEILSHHNYKNIVLAQKRILEDKRMISSSSGGLEMLQF